MKSERMVIKKLHENIRKKLIGCLSSEFPLQTPNSIINCDFSIEIQKN